MTSILQKTIAAALADERLDLKETKKILEAVGPTVTGSEAKAIADVYERAVSVPGAGPPIKATRTALDKLNEFFVAEGLPIGGNKERMRQSLQVRLENVDRGPALGKAPSVASYTSLTLRDDREAGGPRETVFIRPGSGRAYLRSDGAKAAKKAKWYGPFDVDTLAQGRVTALVPQQLSSDRMNALRTSMEQDLGHMSFDHPSLPSGAFVDLGTLSASGGALYRVFLPQTAPGASLDDATQYVVRREAGSAQPMYSGLIDVAPFADPATDGKVSGPMKARARQQFLQREFAETHHWHAGAPPSSIKLVRASVATYGDAYFVVGTSADASLKDPDAATQVYFRHRAAKMWSGPFAIEPLYA